MPTNARKAFDQNTSDIKRLLEIHKNVGGDGPGRKYGVEVLNKSAIVLITAVWEAYCEDLAEEALQHLVGNGAPGKLPKGLRKQVAQELKNDKHELAVWSLCEEGWKRVLADRLEDIAKKRNFNWNTPKADRVDAFFNEVLGVAEVTSSWSWPGMTAEQARNKLDKYVSLRGEIAHRGAAEDPVKKAHVEDYFAHVGKLAAKTGGRVSSALKSLTGKPLFTAKKKAAKKKAAKKKAAKKKAAKKKAAKKKKT